MKTTYGILSDIHAADPKLTLLAIKFLHQNLGVRKLILNGDIIGERSGFNPQEYLATTLKTAVDTGLEVYAQEGSHEEITLVQPVFDFFSEKFGNFIDACRNPVVDGVGHRLIFLPGSDWHAANPLNGVYRIDDVKIKDSFGASQALESGFYHTEEGPVHLTNIADVVKYTREPERTIVISHIPRAFDGHIETAVDRTYFAERADKSILPGVVVEKAIRQQKPGISDEEVRLIAAKNGFTMKREHRGNQKLRAAFEQAGITKAVSGHFHESVHRAHDSKVAPISDCQYSKELFWAASYVDAGKIGILRVNEEGKVAYQNIELQKYLGKD